MDNILDYFWLIKSVSKKFYNVEKEDLYQAGYLGLLKAEKNYKEEFGEFKSYAYKYIFGEMYNLQAKTSNIKTNKYYLKLYKLIIMAKNSLMQKYNRDVSNKEISDYINIDLEEVEYCINMMMMPLSLDNDENNIQIGYDLNLDNKILINDSLESLDTLSHQVMYYRYLMDLTQSEIANILNISQVKVSRIEKLSKEKILKYIS